MVETPAIKSAAQDAGLTIAHEDDHDQIVRRVLDKLGRPGNLSSVRVKKLWDNKYRVNVYCVEERDGPFSTVSMTDSFFVALVDEGIEASPAIKRKYGRK